MAKKASASQKTGKKRVKAAKTTDLPISDTNITNPIKESSKPILKVNNLSRNYKKKAVLEDITFEVAQGDIFGIIGLSGSGKTTLFHLLNGIDRPTAGDVLVKRDLILKPSRNPDKDLAYVSVFNNASAAHKKFGYASQFPSFYEHLTVQENLKIFGELFGVKKKRVKELIPELLALTSLEAEKDSIGSNLSGGMQRRLDIACALISEPNVLFLDEPTSDLDPILRKQMWSLIKKINATGTTIMFSSHILDEIEHLCSNIAIIHNKKILGYGNIDELKALFSTSQEVHIRLLHGNYDKLKSKLKTFKIEKSTIIDNRLVLTLPKGFTDLNKLVRAIDSCKDKLLELEVRDATLNEIFEFLTKKKEEAK